MSNFHLSLVIQICCNFGQNRVANMAKNSAVQYEVVAVDDEDGVQWRRGKALAR